MKENIFLLCLLLPLVLMISCNENSKPEIEEFVIVNSKSNQVISMYEYNQEKELVRTRSYSGTGECTDKTEYKYDNEKQLTRTVKQATDGEITDIHYSNEKEYSPDNRLVRSLQETDSGKKYEVHYGYDEKGTLRGVVEVDHETDTVIMMDYE